MVIRKENDIPMLLITLNTTDFGFFVPLKRIVGAGNIAQWEIACLSCARLSVQSPAAQKNKNKCVVSTQFRTICPRVPAVALMSSGLP